MNKLKFCVKLKLYIFGFSLYLLRFAFFASKKSFNSFFGSFSLFFLFFHFLYIIYFFIFLFFKISLIFGQFCAFSTSIDRFDLQILWLLQLSSFYISYTWEVNAIFFCLRRIITFHFCPFFFLIDIFFK